jgi:2-desacetyl-2-hydroxyethyl bacteriochlorophyllide A dehydrogenase
MQSAVYSGPQKIRIEQRQMPAPGAGEALIRVEAVAICGSDQARFWDSSEVTLEPVVFGHEFSGRIVSAPAGTGFKAGERVAVAPLFNCGECEFCMAGLENMCPKRRHFGVLVDGAMQEYVCVPENRVYRLPTHISLEEGALIEPLAVATHTVLQAGVPNGEPVLVLGAGAIGLLIAQVWRALGYGYATVVEIDPKRMEVAAQLGIPVWDRDPQASSFSKIFEATGSAQAFSKWLPALAPRGLAIIVSKLAGQAKMDWLDLLRKEGGIKTSRYFTLADFEKSIDLVEEGAVQLRPLIGQIVPFQKLAENHGIEVMTLAKGAVRLLVRM